jgi:hypothetical protein
MTEVTVARAVAVIVVLTVADIVADKVVVAVVVKMTHFVCQC